MKGFKLDRAEAKAMDLVDSIPGAHASRTVTAASGRIPGGVEALGRFRRHAGSGARRQRRLEAAGSRRRRVRSLDCIVDGAENANLGGFAWTGWYAGHGSPWMAGCACLATRSFPGAGVGLNLNRTELCVVRPLGWQKLYKGVVGLGTGAAVPGTGACNS